MAVPSPSGRHGALAARLWLLPRSLAHPVVLTFLVAAYFSYVTGDTVRAGYLLAVGLALTWDQVRRRIGRPSAGPGRANHGGEQASEGEGQTDPGDPAQIAFSGESVDRRRGSRIPTVGALFTRIMHSRTGRIAVVAWWAWLGLHLFSK